MTHISDVHPGGIHSQRCQLTCSNLITSWPLFVNSLLRADPGLIYTNVVFSGKVCTTQSKINLYHLLHISSSPTWSNSALPLSKKDIWIKIYKILRLWKFFLSHWKLCPPLTPITKDPANAQIFPLAPSMVHNFKNLTNHVVRLGDLYRDHVLQY